MAGLIIYFYSFLGSTFAHVIDFFTAPLLNILKHYIPDLNDYFTMFTSFFDTYIFPGIQFAKMSFINFANINHRIWTFFVLGFLIVCLLYFNLSLLKLAYNVWRIYRGTQNTGG